MVESPGARSQPGLFSSRRPGGKTLLAVSRGTVQQRDSEPALVHARTIRMTGFAELAVTTNFSFLRGGSHPEELVGQAIALGLKGIGIADRNRLAGVVRAHVFVRENTELAKNFRVVTGARLVFADGTPDILAYPCDRAAYGRLSKLLTIGN